MALTCLHLQADNAPPPDSDVGVLFTEIFVKTPENVALLLSLLQEVDFHVRLNSVKLLTTLLTNRAAQLQVQKLARSPAACHIAILGFCFSVGWSRIAHTHTGLASRSASLPTPPVSRV